MKALLDMTIEELRDAVAALGEPRFRAAQVRKWLMAGVLFEEMSNLPTGLRERLRSEYEEGYLRVLQELESVDGTRKYLFGLADGNTIESVYLPRDYGAGVCVSTQVGCAMGCLFCASCTGGLVRDLTAGEILAQVVRINADRRDVDHIVLMGMGEPLANYDNVLRFIRAANDKAGLNIGIRNITLSTCGLTGEMEKLAGEGMGLTLSVSLHAATQEKRERIMPSAKKYPLEAIIEAADLYFQQTGRRVTFEYALIDGFNDGVGDVAALAGLLGGKNCHINIIPLNAWGRWRPPQKRAVYAFCEKLAQAGLSATVRQSMGSDIQGACGQLRQAGGGWRTIISGSDDGRHLEQINLT